MKIQGNDIHLTNDELMMAVMDYVSKFSVEGQNMIDPLTTRDVYGLAAPVRIAGEKHAFILSVAAKEAGPAVA